MLLTYTDTCTLIPPVQHFKPCLFITINWAASIGTAPQNAIYRAIQWRHKRAKSFDIYDFTYTSFSGYPVENITIWYSCKVRYYSTAKEGMFKIPADFTNNWKHEVTLLAVLGIDP